MRNRLMVALALTSMLAIGIVGCHKNEEATSSTGGDTQTGKAAGKGATAGQAPSLGLNPNYQGPANGGVGSKAGGGQ